MVTSEELMLDDLLAPASPWAIFAFGAERALDNFVRAAPEDVDARIVRGSRCKKSSDLLREWAAVLQFPYYFGHNWDAFNECVNDLEWVRSGRLIIAISTIEDVLLEEPERFEQTFVKRLSAAARRPGDPPRPWRDQPPAGPQLVRFIFHSDQSHAIERVLAAADEPIEVRQLPQELAR